MSALTVCNCGVKWSCLFIMLLFLWSDPPEIKLGSELKELESILDIFSDNCQHPTCSNWTYQRQMFVLRPNNFFELISGWISFKSVQCCSWLTHFSHTQWALYSPEAHGVCFVWVASKPGAGVSYQPLLVPLPRATHPTWSRASTPLERSKLGKVDRALSVLMPCVNCLH